MVESFFISITIVILVMCMVLFVRNFRVYNFRRKLLDEESEWVSRRTHNELEKFLDGHYEHEKEIITKFDGFHRFNNLESYNKMLFKFWKPLSNFVENKPLEDYYKTNELL